MVNFCLFVWYGLLFKECLRFFVFLERGFDGTFRPITDFWTGPWPSDYYASDMLLIPMCIFWIWYVRRLKIAIANEKENSNEV